MINAANIDYKAEIARKAIHFCSLSIPIIYYFIERDLALEILMPVTLGFLIVDLLRYYHQPTADLFYMVFRFMLRQHEQDHTSKRLNGATNVLIAATICVLIFPKLIVLTAIPILIISDSVAALFGRRYGKRKFLQKSVEGSLAFFVFALIVIYFTPKMEYSLSEYMIGAIAALVGTIVEAGSWKIDDNLSIPLSVGLVMWGLYFIVYPSVNLFSLTIH
ncbi:MAG: diacylglycerol/polyprenol kinase family protein [Bacteriovoracaceae bacterium]|nr:SEC59/DGK1/VTE5 family protein [Bacteroidota bacterium]